MLSKIALYAAILILSVQGSFAQTSPDFTRIEAAVNDPLSKFYYPRLMERYAVADTTLTFEEYFYLYYGYPSQPSYKPLLSLQVSDSLERVFGRRTTPTFETFREAASLASQVLATEPFNLRDINAHSYSLFQMGDTLGAERQNRKLKMIERVIKSTGTGLVEKSPWYVTYKDHAVDILGLMGLSHVKTIIISTTVEYLQLSIPIEKIKGYYFHIGEIYRRKPDYLKDVPKQKRRWEINNTEPWKLKDKR